MHILYKLLLDNRKISKLCKDIANNSTANIELSIIKVSR